MVARKRVFSNPLRVWKPELKLSAPKAPPKDAPVRCNSTQTMRSTERTICTYGSTVASSMGKIVSNCRLVVKDGARGTAAHASLGSLSARARAALGLGLVRPAQTLAKHDAALPSRFFRFRSSKVEAGLALRARPAPASYGPSYLMTSYVESVKSAQLL